MKKIITGVDTSQTALAAAQKAAVLADAMDAELHVFSAYNTSTTDTVVSAKTRHQREEASTAYQKLREGKALAAQQIAEAVAAVLQEEHPDVTIVAAAVEGTPAEVLVGQSAELDADMVVVGNKHVQGIARILGSVAQKVAAEAKCDLHIVNTTNN